MGNVKYYNKILDLLKELKKEYPTFNIGRHLSTVLSDYGDAWGIRDEELYHAFERYKANLELYDGIPISDDSEVEKIIRQSQNEELFNLDDYNEEEDDI